VYDQNAAPAKRRKHIAARLDRDLEPRHVIAERGAEPSGLEKIALHVDDDEGGMRKVDTERRRFGFDFDYRHAAPPVDLPAKDLSAKDSDRIGASSSRRALKFRKNRATAKLPRMSCRAALSVPNSCAELAHFSAALSRGMTFGNRVTTVCSCLGYGCHCSA
jgi:hypothetical protein